MIDDCRVHAVAGSVLGVHPRVHSHQQATARRGRHAAVLQSVCTVDSSDGAHAGEARTHLARARHRALASDPCARRSVASARGAVAWPYNSRLQRTTRRKRLAAERERSADKRRTTLIEIRDEQPGDVGAVREVNRQAFDQEHEGLIVDALREHGGALAGC